MKNVQLLVLFGMITTFTGMNASENKFEECLRLKEELVEALSRVSVNDRTSYMKNYNSLYDYAARSCSMAKHGNLHEERASFDKELNRDLLDRDAKKTDCDKIRKELGAALSITTNDTAVKGIIDAYASELARCN